MSRPRLHPRPDWRTPRVCPAPECPRRGAPFVPDCPPRSERMARVYCSVKCRRCAQRARRRARLGLPPPPPPPDRAKTCARPDCGHPFEARNCRQRFCSRPCEKIEERRRRSARTYPRKERTCPCGTTFQVCPAFRRYCSVKCRDEYSGNPPAKLPAERSYRLSWEQWRPCARPGCPAQWWPSSHAEAQNRLYCDETCAKTVKAVRDKARYAAKAPRPTPVSGPVASGPVASGPVATRPAPVAPSLSEETLCPVCKGPTRVTDGVRYCVRNRCPEALERIRRAS